MNTPLKKQPTVSVIICTYNRSKLLRLCLNSLIEQTADIAKFEIIIVDNNSSDNTQELILEYTNIYSHIISVFEPNTGLSFARNTGYKYATSDWILYIDDDAKAFPNMVERAIYTATNYPYLCFGGIVNSYFNTDKIPKWWGIDSFESNLYLLKKYDTGVHALENESPYGDIFVVNKTLLIDLNGFKTNLGMKGNKIGYGEETDLVQRIRQKGLPIGIDTEMRIYHLVPDIKLKFSWQLRAAFAKGYNSPHLLDTGKKTSLQQIGYFILTPIRYIRIIGYTIKSVIIKPNYFIGNAMLSILGSFYYDVGKILALFEIYKEKVSHRVKN